MANVAYGIGNDAKINSIPINDGLILFNITQHTLSMDSNNARNIYGSNNINIISSKNLSTNSTYSKVYVDDNFMLQNSFATTSETSNLLGNTTALTNDCTQSISKVLNDNMRSISITDLNEYIDIITTNYNESVISTYSEPFEHAVGYDYKYDIKLHHKYDFLIVEFVNKQTHVSTTKMLIDMQIINNNYCNQFNDITIEGHPYYDMSNTGSKRNQLNGIWKPQSNIMTFTYEFRGTYISPTSPYNVTCKGYIYNK